MFPINHEEIKYFTDQKFLRNMVKFDIGSGIYSDLFRFYLDHHGPAVNPRLIFKSVLAFAIQITLTGLLIYSYAIREKFFLTLNVGSPELNGARLLCSILLHLQTIQEILEALSMMAFAIKNPQAFKNNNIEWPMIAALFKIFGGFGCAAANVFLLMQSPDITNVIKDFVAVGIINEVDNVIATSRFTSAYFNRKTA